MIQAEGCQCGCRPLIKEAPGAAATGGVMKMKDATNRELWSAYWRTGEPIRLLLVEDNAGYATLLRDLISTTTESAPVLECANRLSVAVERLARGGIDLVLLDLTLPDSQGLEALRRIRLQTPQVPIIVLTASDDPELARQSLAVGAKGFFLKMQIDTGALLQGIRDATAPTRGEMLRMGEHGRGHLMHFHPEPPGSFPEPPATP